MQSRADQSHPLFGGALSAVLPHSAKDTSELREIPDNQEVFVHEHTDQSLIVELVEYQSQVENEDAARYHFEDIAGSNKALEPDAFEVTSSFPDSSSAASAETHRQPWTVQDFQRLLQTLTLHNPGLFG
ncbi:hypothetical protein KUCAC02_023572 [Chaenocephalus aceratus]|uniref:Uncharacterized protein n=1 Tax=Chaenocephalus aceratus TaxID=36190 RepID=A0ACB9XR35_CHAAC|nr:hypothetical protein KUCAC02_023572 [Chaenocephalus aceratus]